MKKSFVDYRPTSYFFDWLMMGGLRGVTDIIRRDFTITRNDIYIHEDNGTFIPRDRTSGLAFLHDFGCMGKKFDNLPDCESALSITLDDSLAKYAYLGQKTKKIFTSRYKLGLIYFGTATEDNFRELMDVLASVFRRKFYIINVLDSGLHEPTINDGSVCNVFVDDSKGPKTGTSQAWQGWDESWHKALSIALNQK